MLQNVNVDARRYSELYNINDFARPLSLPEKDCLKQLSVVFGKLGIQDQVGAYRPHDHLGLKPDEFLLHTKRMVSQSFVEVRTVKQTPRAYEMAWRIGPDWKLVPFEFSLMDYGMDFNPTILLPAIGVVRKTLSDPNLFGFSLLKGKYDPTKIWIEDNDTENRVLVSNLVARPQVILESTIQTAFRLGPDYATPDCGCNQWCIFNSVFSHSGNKTPHLSGKTFTASA